MAPAEWKQVHEIKGSDGLTIRVQRRGDVRPQYSYQIGQERRAPADSTDPDGFFDDRLVPFVRLGIHAKSAPMVNRESLELVEQALDWVEQDAAKFKSNYLDPQFDDAPRGRRDDRRGGFDRDRDRGGRRR